MYATYVVPHYPHILTLGYRNRPFIRLRSSIFSAHSSKIMSEHRTKRSNRRYNEHKREDIYAVSRREGGNQGIISVFVYGSHKDQEQHK